MIGYYLGWLQQQNNYSISQSVALHFWINAVTGAYEIEREGEAEVALILVIPGIQI
jgi:hypothetical protein